MAIGKQDYYEGAALAALLRSEREVCIRFKAPFFVLNHTRHVYLKYSTKGRSPWQFTFAPDEQSLLRETGSTATVTLALVCGSDGVAALELVNFERICATRHSSITVSCYRQHRENYRIRGPDGWHAGTVAPSAWTRVLKGG